MRKKTALSALAIFVLSIGSILLYMHVLQLDERYSNLIEDGTNQLKLIQRLSFESNRGYILLLKIVHAEDVSEVGLITEKIAEREAITDRNTKILDSLLSATQNDDAKIHIQNVISARQYYRVKAEATLAATRADSNRVTVIRNFEQQADPAFVNYQIQINKLFVQKRETISSNSNNFSSEFRNKAGMILALSFSPFIMLGLVLALSVSAIYLIYTITVKGLDDL